MKNIDNPYPKRLRLAPLLFGALGGSRRQQIIGNFGRNSLSFQFFMAGVQYGFRAPEMTQEGVGSSQSETSDEGHAQDVLSSTVAFHEPD